MCTDCMDLCINFNLKLFLILIINYFYFNTVIHFCFPNNESFPVPCSRAQLPSALKCPHGLLTGRKQLPIPSVKFSTSMISAGKNFCQWWFTKHVCVAQLKILLHVFYQVAPLPCEFFEMPNQSEIMNIILKRRQLKGKILYASTYMSQPEKSSSWDRY